jgi:hypothetical protein
MNLATKVEKTAFSMESGRLTVGRKMTDFDHGVNPVPGGYNWTTQFMGETNTGNTGT